MLIFATMSEKKWKMVAKWSQNILNFSRFSALNQPQVLHLNTRVIEDLLLYST
jgi:hypothetical protein